MPALVRYALPCAGVLLFLPALVVADPELETIQVTASRRAEPAFEVPAAVSMVGRDEIRATAPQTVMESLRNQPGASLQQTTPGQGIVILRGLKGSEVLHVVDGFRLNDAIFRNAPNQYVALVDSQALERIETVRGPLSTLYGGDAMGGVVQMLTWEPRFDGASWQTAGRLRTSYGTADSSTLSRAEGAVGRDGMVISAGATYQDVNERRVGGGEELPYTRFTARAADAKVRASLDAENELTLSLQYAEQPHTPRYDELTPGYGQTAPNSAVYWFEPQRRDFASLRWRGTARTAAWDSIEAQVGQQVIEDGRRYRDFGSRNEDRERNVDTSRGLSLAAVKGIGDVHHITYGADLYTDDVESSRARTNIATGAVSVRAPRFPDGSTMLQAGVFVADDWEARDNLDVLAGARWSYSRTELPRSGAFDPTEVSDAGLTGNLGVSYRAAESVRLVANVGEGFRAPNVFDLGTFGDRPGNRFNVPNPHLEPEHVTTVDAGIKFDSGRLAGEFIAYHSTYRDKITSVLTGEVTSSGRLVVQSQNAASLTLQGLEFVLRQRLGDTFEWHTQLTWTRGEERLDGDEYPADRIPPLNGSAGIAWTPSPRWSLEAWANFADAQDRYSPRDAIDPRIRPGGTPGWSTWNVRAGWQTTEHLYASLQAGNLGDRRYREYGSGLDAAGRGVVLTLEWAW
ncbi:MAG: TonB-dependent receptor [Gammaproteobacteria bacterium]|nr:TonB-dependent receptor [Gammaproteobacteria bacterium]MDH5175556.1 TonB-dependent receptor [Gammaproteobacteria bacterium]MDH5226695.1 TonB-dependent receptor [Gammaproteobacteria bacterium]